jgi:hypothetical protein
VVHTQAEAKRFFADKVVQQALADAVALSDVERQMLLWSECDPTFRADPTLVDKLASEISDEEYEAKISGLLQRALEREVAVNARAIDQWRQARTLLKEGDHYILVFVDRAAGRKLRRVWEFWR